MIAVEAESDLAKKTYTILLPILFVPRSSEGVIRSGVSGVVKIE